MIEKDKSLKKFNTFSIAANAETFFTLTSVDQIPDLVKLVNSIKKQNKPVLILGGGSNTLFCRDFAGLIIKVELMGYESFETDQFHKLRIGAGQNWHKLVVNTIEDQIYGLENLALIPGVVGAAPVQNIGAYGVEFKDFCESVEYCDLNTGGFYSLNKNECLFGYRDSIFKSENFKDCLITSVTISMHKDWKPQSRYGSNQESEKTTSPQQIFKSVCEIRTKKLPDPNLVGNAGSFFKNPIISNVQLEELLEQHPDMPFYKDSSTESKLAAGWLIDKAGLKGLRVGGAAVHMDQALVLINENNATAKDIIRLAWQVKQAVKDKFQINLEPEVLFVGSLGVTNLEKEIANVRT